MVELEYKEILNLERKQIRWVIYLKRFATESTFFMYLCSIPSFMIPIYSQIIFFWEMQIRIMFAFSVIGLEISGKKKTFDFDYLVQIIWCIRQMASKTFLVQRFWVPLVIGS